MLLGSGKATAAEALQAASDAAWQTRSAGNGAKGLRLFDWAWITLAMLAYAFLAATRVNECETPEADMIPLTCNEIRHLLISAREPETGWEHCVRWSRWRRCHQATAKRLHYQRQHTLAA